MADLVTARPPVQRTAQTPPRAARFAGPEGRRRLPTGWPVTFLLIGYPVLWALGVSAFAMQLAAVPMAYQLYRRGRVLLPRAFTWWGLFLLCSTLGILVLGVNPPGTVPGSAGGRLLGFAIRQSTWIAFTVVLLYIGTTSEKELSRERIRRALDVFFAYVVVGGVLGLLLPYAGFPSLLESVLPSSLTSVNYVYHLVHPAFAQVQEFGGDTHPRPSAPYPYTNSWAGALVSLSVWYAIRTAQARTFRAGALRVLLLLTALVTVVLSLNRGAWLGALVCVVFAVGALLRRGRVLPLLGVLLVVLLGASVLLTSPLRNVIDSRIENGHSNSIRAFTTERALELSVHSPVIGFGSTRNAIGSASSIAVGKSPECQNCGNDPIGINGYFFTLLVTTGIGGTALFFGFWTSQMFLSRRDRSAEASGDRLVVLLSMFLAFFYNIDFLLPAIALALLWRRRLESQSGQPVAMPPTPLREVHRDQVG